MVDTETIAGQDYRMRTVKGKRMYKMFSETENAVQLLSTGRDIIAFDLETTGVKVDKDFIAEISIQRYRFNGKGYQKCGALSYFVKPPVPMPKEASDVNHITNELLADKPTISEVFPKINAFIGNPDQVIFMGYNSRSFDIPMLNRVYQRELGINILDIPNIDVFLMAKELILPEECEDQKITLSNSCKVFDLTSDNFHDSSEDVEMTGRLFQKLIALYPTYRGFYYLQSSLPKLRITWMKRIKANFVKQGTSAYITFGVDGLDSSGIRRAGSMYYDVTKKRLVDNSDDHKTFIGHFDMNDLFIQVSSLVNNKQI